MKPELKLIECPRDAMQGWEHFIPTEKKISYINQLLKVGFDVLDFGSFVSAKAIPQMQDTHEVIRALDLSNTSTKLLAIVANLRGAQEAVAYDTISYLGFPFSISETFQLRNTHKTIQQSLQEVEAIQQLCIQHNKKLVIYISMGFGNPYGDPYSPEITIQWFEKLTQIGVEIIALSDTVGVAEPKVIADLFSTLVPEFPKVELGGHFHSTPDTWKEKIQAAYDGGCRRFDGSINGIGGCPMAEDELVGNIAMENLVDWADSLNLPLQLDKEAFAKARLMAYDVFI